MGKGAGCIGSKTNVKSANEAQGAHKMADSGPAGEEEFQPLTEQEITERIVASKAVEILEVKSAGYRVRYAYVSQRGYYPEDLNKANQDSFYVKTEFAGDNTALFGVYDGHGGTGDKCSQFVVDKFPDILSAKMKEHPDDYQKACKQAHIDVNNLMHGQPDLDDTLSGTTAITVYLENECLHVSNVGDSRAIIAEQRGTRNIAYSLSIDQTPFRRDERERVKQCGASVMTMDQLEGLAPMHEDWGVNLGEELDDGGDPPRVWIQGKTYPGTAFTRSFGDRLAETVGVYAEPEMLSKELTPNDQFCVIASDGVFEFLTNQSVADMVSKFTDPLEACRTVVSEAYRLWLQYEVRTDDITMICLFFDGLNERENGEMGGRKMSMQRSMSMHQRRSSRRGSAEGVTVGDGTVASEENRPVRRGLSKEKREAIMTATAAAEVDETYDVKANAVPKTDDETRRIQAAVKANFLFQHLNASQKDDVLAVMRRKDVKAGDTVIKQGDPGDWFYVVDQGTFDVTINNAEGGGATKIHTYETTGGTNPSFGELALMYSKPRAANVVAKTDGLLWGLDRQAFRSILMKSSSSSLTRTLRSVDVFRSLSVTQLQRLQDILSEVSFKDGDSVIRQGELSDTFYVIKTGEARCTRKEVPEDENEAEQEVMRLKENQYFGERALLHDAPRAANVIAVGHLKCLHIGREAFEEVLGPLQAIIDADRRRRELVANKKQLQQEAEGLADVTPADFEVKQTIQIWQTGAIQLVENTKNPGQQYTMRLESKQKLVDNNSVATAMREVGIVKALHKSSPVVPLVLATLQDECCVYTMHKAHCLMDLHTLLDEPFSEAQAIFVGASCVIALSMLHKEDIAFRNLTPESLLVNDLGYIQLVDFRLAKKVDGVTHTLVGTPDYLAPEMIGGAGHTHSVDWWALGVLMYEMLMGNAPFSSSSSKELDIYAAISAHTYGANKLPEQFKPEMIEFVVELLHPEPEKRRGSSGAGAEEVENHLVFFDIDFPALEVGRTVSPLAQAVTTKREAAGQSFKANDGAVKEMQSDRFMGDPVMFEGF